MAINYQQRLANTQNRKFDTVLNESLTSKSFSSKEIPDNVKYLLEGMRPIGKKYNNQTISAANNVMTHLETGLNLHFERAYRRQGSVETDTNIKAHSDIDLLTVIDKYHYLPSHITPDVPYTESDPDNDIRSLRKQIVSIMRNKYDEVDDTNDKCVTIFNKNLRRKVDIVPAYWFHGDQYLKNYEEFYRGVKIGSKLAHPDFPFAHISNVNYKGNATSDGSRRAIRLLKTLRADCDSTLDYAKSFQLTTIVHEVDNKLLNYYPGLELNIASAVSVKLREIIIDPDYRKSIASPNGMEKPLTDDKIVRDLQLLKKDLDEVIIDASREVNREFRIKNLVALYS